MKILKNLLGLKDLSKEKDILIKEIKTLKNSKKHWNSQADLLEFRFKQIQEMVEDQEKELAIFSKKDFEDNFFITLGNISGIGRRSDLNEKEKTKEIAKTGKAFLSEFTKTRKRN